MSIEPFGSATSLLQQIQSREIRCVDALEALWERYQTHNPELNAIVATNIEDARKRAVEADQALDRGESWGPLHGLPMTIKDSYEVVGMPTTSGAPQLKDYQSKKNADAVQRLVDAGAIVFGKTNLPLFAGDWQSFNDVYGTTNNPWDRTRTPGGSSGGAAASLAAGLTPLELGSDIGGSIRSPAHYCGVYGHKPTYGLVSQRGHIPGPPGTKGAADLGVMGPMARYAEDLSLALDVLVGPELDEPSPWNVLLPPSRHQRLQDFRVAVWFQDSHCPLEPEVQESYDALLSSLEEAGVSVDTNVGEEFDMEEIHFLYLRLLGGVLGPGLPKKVYNKLRKGLPLLRLKWLFQKPAFGSDVYLQAMLQSHRDWMSANEKRAKLRQTYMKFFQRYDVLLMPIVPWVAFPHIQEGTIFERKLQFGKRTRNYNEHLPWIGFATALGFPSTSAPLGVHEPSGLPVNVQVVGGPYDDHTCITFARLLAEVHGGFTSPPDYR